jgi:hypothetical protein
MKTTTRALLIALLFLPNGPVTADDEVTTLAPIEIEGAREDEETLPAADQEAEPAEESAASAPDETATEEEAESTAETETTDEEGEPEPDPITEEDLIAAERDFGATALEDDSIPFRLGVPGSLPAPPRRAIRSIRAPNPIGRSFAYDHLGPIVGRLNIWCDNVIPILEQGQELANYYEYLGQDAAAFNVLVDTMVDALAVQQSLGRGRTLTGITLVRGLHLIRRLQNDFRRNLDLQTPALLNFAGSWVQLVLDVTIDVDRRFYIPYMTYIADCQRRHRRGARLRVCRDSFPGLPGFDLPRFHQRFVDLARRQLDLVINDLMIGNSPIGSADYILTHQFYLRAVQYVALTVAGEDLGLRTHGYRQSCSIQALYQVADFIQRNINYPRFLPMTTARVDAQIQAVRASLGASSCRYSYPRRIRR